MNSRMETPSMIPIALLALLGTVVLYLTYNVATIVYNVFFHPLRNYPGPWYTAASRVPYLIKVIKGDYLTWNQSLHRRYGQVVRVAPEELSFTDGRSWRDIYGHRSGGKVTFSKDRRFYFIGNPTHPETPILVMTDDQNHPRVRKVFNNAFSNSALQKQEPLFLEHVDRLLKAIEQKGPAKFDLVTLFHYITFDIMGELVFGEPLGLFDGNEYYRAWVKGLFSDIKASSIWRIGYYYPFFLRLLEFLVPKKLQEERLESFRLANARIDKRMAEQTNHPDIWSLSEREDKDGKPRLSVGEMHVNASGFMLAGTETSATVLSAMNYYLLKHPAKLKRLTDEISTSFTRTEDMTLERLAQLPYLAACIEESLRLFHPAPNGFGRFVPQGGATIAGHWVPEGTVVATEHNNTYRDPANFRRPDDFIPERWFDPAFNSDRKIAFEPFSYGPRNCIGKNLAYHELRLIEAKLLWSFDFHLQEESNDWLDQKAYMVWEKNPLMVTATPTKR
ncbi:cytochrome P450 [Viridothelium virens]|uniref:Cytochrome P450 n=1 Tax=Viridothelium virens TaxID=1048519 RepID=A0A6A6HJF1_VIRVR|nr:cytochrome P450 [Viridothelium virens]